MREIKFRGKRKDNGEWVYGYYVFSPKSTSLSGQQLTEFDVDQHFIISKNRQYEVLPETVGQYISWKDKNKEDLYEGDICKRIFFGDELVGVIRYDEKESRYGLYIESQGFFELTSEIEKIGNSFDREMR